MKSSNEIRTIVLETILAPSWARREEFAPGTGSSPWGLLPINVDRIATDILSLQLDRLSEIIPEGGTHPKAGFQIAGVMDRELGRIAISRKFPQPCQRYTGGHEVGHFCNHPNELYHRDPAAIGSERTDERGRPTQEVVDAPATCDRALPQPIPSADDFP